MKSQQNRIELVTRPVWEQRGPALIDLLQQIQQNVAILKPRMEKFVVELLRIGKGLILFQTVFVV